MRGSRLGRDIRQYVEELTKKGLTSRYVQQYRRTLNGLARHCESLGIGATGRIDLSIVLSYLERYQAMSATYQRAMFVQIRGYLANYGNPALAGYRPRIRGRARFKVDWLTTEEYDRLFETPMSPEQEVLIGGCSLLGLRRIEILRLTVEDVKRAMESRNPHLIVQAKCKIREVPLTPDYAEIITRYLAYSGRTTGRLLGFERTQSERYLAEYCQRFGRKFGFHTLRRTFARELMLRDVKIETISTILGHESSDTTRDYIGLNLSDMSLAMQKLSLVKRSAARKELAP